MNKFKPSCTNDVLNWIESLEIKRSHKLILYGIVGRVGDANIPSQLEINTDITPTMYGISYGEENRGVFVFNSETEEVNYGWHQNDRLIFTTSDFKFDVKF